jgi:histidyl-tRNA synthetase
MPPGASAADVAAVIEATIGPTDANAGVRSRAEIVERLARKQLTTSDPESFDRAFELIARLAAVKGEPDEALEQGGRIITQAGGDAGAIEPLRRVIDAARVEGVTADSLAVDLGLARGIAYYTGMVFDLHRRRTDGESLGGGGRYDGLTRALGAVDDLPALGFAYNLESVLEEAAPQPAGGSAAGRVVVVPSDDSSIESAIREAARLRDGGSTAILDFETRSPEALQEYARNAGASEIDFVASDGTSRREVVR